MGRVLGWVGIVAAVVAALLPVNVRVLGSDVACGPAVVALGRNQAVCQTPAASWVGIAAVLLLAGLTAVCWGRTLGGVPAGEVAIYGLVAVIVLGIGGLIFLG